MTTTKSRKEQKLEIDFKLLKLIAEYYEFPVAVFYSSISDFKRRMRKHKTRREKIKKTIKKMMVIKRMLREMVEEL